MDKPKQFDLQDHLIDYAVRIIALSEALPWKLDIPCWAVGY
jgi:hypothetical protein